MHRLTRNGKFEFLRTVPVKLTRRQRAVRGIYNPTTQAVATVAFVAILGFFHMRFTGGGIKVAPDRTMSAMVANIEKMALNVATSDEPEPDASNHLVFYESQVRRVSDRAPTTRRSIPQLAPEFRVGLYDSTTRR